MARVVGFGVCLLGLNLGTTEAIAKDGVSLRVLTVNAWGLPRPIAPDRAHRLPAIASWLRGQRVDVAGMQELWNGSLVHLPLPVHRDEEAGDNGLAVHSPHEVSDVTVHRFEVARGFDALKRKGALRARVTLEDGQHVWVVVTHMQAGRTAGAARVRSIQLEQILGLLREVEGPAILMGDLNFDDGQPIDTASHERLVASGYLHAATKAATYSDGNRYDRVYLRDGETQGFTVEGAEVLAWEDGPLSDHLPVMVRLVLSER